VKTTWQAGIGRRAVSDQVQYGEALSGNTADGSYVDAVPEAPAWRRRVALGIDLAAVLVVFALFLTPVIAVYAGRGPASSLLQVSAWVYVAIFVGLAVRLVAERTGERARRKLTQPYVTVGTSIMDLYPVGTDRARRLVRRTDLPAGEAENEKRGRATALVAVPAFLVGVAFVVVELLAYT
jgi:hypothetical protein